MTAGTGGGVDPWPMGGSDPWPFSVSTENAAGLLEGLLKGRRLLVLDPSNPFATTEFDPNRVQITVDASRKILSVKIG
jgi:hypothetical protein